MNRFEWKSVIQTNVVFLKLAGLWSPDNSKVANLYVVHSALLFLVFAYGDVSFQIIKLLGNLNDFETVTETVYILLIELLLLFKIYYFMKNFKLLKELLDILDNDLFQPLNKEQIAMIHPSLNLWKTIYNALFLASLGANFFWTLFPVLDQSSEERRLPFLAWYPYNWKITPFYEITYFYQIVSCLYMSGVHINIDTFIAILNVYSGNQIDILCDNLKNLTDIKGEVPVEDKFVYCVSHHRLILRFVKKCNKFCNQIILLQFFVSGTSIGITLFQLTLVVPLSNQFYSLISYSNAIIVQIFMQCWFGNEVKVKSGNIPYAVFESDWTDLPEGVKRSLIFFIMKTQKPLNISALNLFSLTLETFLKILKTAWSYFALLNQINSKN